MNRKGFAISGLVYGILIIFLLLIFSVLGILVGRKASLDKIRDNALAVVTGKNVGLKLDPLPNILADWSTMYINNEVATLDIDYLNLGVSSPTGYKIENETDFSLGSPNKKYNITYKAVDGAVIDQVTKNIIEKNDIIYNFAYTGDRQETVLGPGIYKLEVWGASGGMDTTISNGSYASGYLVLDSVSKLYIYVGGRGSDKLDNPEARTPGGFNGADSGYNGSTGGGASDIRINNDSLFARVIVANGGSGTVSTGGNFFNNDGGFTWTDSNRNKVNNIGGIWLLKENQYLLNDTIISGSSTMVSPDGSSEVGHSDNGYVRITSIVSVQ